MNSMRLLFAFLTVFLVTLFLHPSIAYGDDVTYAITVVKVHVTALEEATIYGTLKLRIPKYLVVDKENEIYVVFERSGGCWDGVAVIFYISARIFTSSGAKDYDLSTVSFSIGCGSPTQERTIKIVIPKTVYDASIDKLVSIYVRSIDVSKPLVITVKGNIVSNVPATARLVTRLPEPILHVLNLQNGYLNLDVDEVRGIKVEITSYYAPTVISDIVIDAPSFVATYLDTPLPLTIEANQSIQVLVRIRGVSSGAGVVKIAVKYLIGDAEKKITVYVPVIVASDELDALIGKYKQIIEQYKQAISELERELNIKIETIGSATEELNQILTVLQQLTREYKEVLTNVNMFNQTIINEVSMLKEELARLERQYEEVSAQIQALNETLMDNIENLSSLQQELNTQKHMLFLVLILAIAAIPVSVAVNRRL